MRPVECRLCSVVMRQSDYAHHVNSECPSRSAICEMCGVSYQAGHLSTHKSLCEKIQLAKKAIESLRPTVGLEVENVPNREGVKIVGFKGTGMLDGVFQKGDVIFSIGKTPVSGVESFYNILDTYLPGQHVELKAHNSALVGGPWWGTDNSDDHEECDQSVTRRVELLTTIPLSEYRDLNLLIEDDAKRFGEASNVSSQDVAAKSNSFTNRTRGRRRSTITKGSSSPQLI
eukprot:TRINITY_DN6899_c2_g2_i1.p1 TRINITY_DN6899_c2_g2~~TRINITY_DN6899_c2_g2_i1.p1  ORF type:complete len:230 (+),score=39.54 TRINITY_DN6899_c2_g2_i1:767-1456(+)